MNRRGFLRITGIATAATVLGVAPAGHLVYAAALSKAQRDKLTPDEVIALMKKGNERFRLGQESPHDYLAQQKARAKGQYPAAVILSCIDSRAPAETIMDLGIGDCFNARVAGNIANDDIVGSMEFACKVAGAKVVLVMGHTSCGAIKGAIDNVQLGKLTGLLAKIRPAVQGHPLSGRTLGQQLWFCGRGGAQECRVDDGRHPSAQCRAGRHGKLGYGQDRRSDVQHRNGARRILPLTRHNDAHLMQAIATGTSSVRSRTKAE
jgi:carbonic anhydrase